MNVSGKKSPLLSNPRFARAFTRDANKAIAALQEAFAEKDIKKLTSTFHAMKSALAGVGELENSEYAFKLERAGTNGDMELVASEVENFIQMLRDLLPEETAGDGTSGVVEEDTAAVKKQLEAIRTACDNYFDIEVIDGEFKSLLEKPMKSATKEFVTRIRDLLYSDSDFDGVSERIDEFLKAY